MENVYNNNSFHPSAFVSIIYMEIAVESIIYKNLLCQFGKL